MKMIILALAMGPTMAMAKLSLDTDKGNTTFRVNGQVVSSVEALKAAVAGAEVLRCKPKSATGKKVFYTSSGKVDEVVECTKVEVKINPKTGAPSWKAEK